MITVQMSNEEFAIELSGIDAALALKKHVSVPLSAITRAYAAQPGQHRRPEGFRAPGTAWPFGKNPIYYGQYWRSSGNWVFWATNSDEPNRKLVVEVADVPGAGKYRQIVVTVPDATEVADRLNEARADLGSTPGHTNPPQSKYRVAPMVMPTG